MSDSNREKSGFELDVVDLSALSIKKPDENKDEKKPTIQAEEIPEKKEVTPKTIPHNDPPTKKTISPVIWFILIAILIGIGLSYFLIEKNPLPLTTNKTIPPHFNRSITTLVDSIETMRVGLQTIDNISNRINSKQKILTILDAVNSVEQHQHGFTTKKLNFINNVKKFHSELKKEGNTALIAVGDYYQKSPDRNFLSALEDFISVQKKYLTYFHDNYERIHNRQQPQIYTYEKYYLEYTRSIEKYDQASDLSNKAIHLIIQEHPKTKKLFLIRKGTSIFSIE